MAFGFLRRKAAPGLAVAEEAARLPGVYVEGMIPMEQAMEALRARRKTEAVLAGKEVPEEAQLKRCRETMKYLDKPVRNADELREATLVMGSYERMIGRLKSIDLDYIDIAHLLESDVSAFFSEKLLGRLKTAQQRMVTTDQALNALRPSREPENEVEKAMMEEDTDLRRFLASPEAKEVDEEEQQRIRRELEDPTVREARVHRWRMKKDNQSMVVLADKVDYETKLEVTNLLLEARYIRLQQVRRYLEQRYQDLKEKFEGNRSLFDADQQQEMEKVFKVGEQWFYELHTVGAIKDFNGRLDWMEEHLSGSTQGLADLKLNRPKAEAKIQRQYENLKTKTKAFTPERVAALMEARRQEEIKRLHMQKVELPPEEQGFEALARRSSIFRSDIQSLKALSGADLEKMVAEFDERVGRLNELDLTELEAVRQELDSLQNKLGVIPNFDEKVEEAIDPTRISTAHKARRAMNRLKNVRTLDEIREILEKDIGREHVLEVDHAVFERDYRAYTQKGHMVFFERGQDWKIILDREALEDPKNVQELRRQLTHELLHLEFERNHELKDAEIKYFTEQPNWNEIKQAYADAFPDKKPPDYAGPPKSPYSASDWKDEDVISELYAMKEEFEHRREGTDPFNQLRELVLGAAGGTVGLEQARIRGFDGDDVKHDLEKGEAEKGEVTETAKGSHENYKIEIEESERIINELLHSEYLGYLPALSGLLGLMKRYHENTKDLNEAFGRNGSGYLNETIKERTEKVKEDLKTVMAILAETGGEIPNERISIFRNIWNKTSILAVTDLIQVGKDVVEFFKRRHERKKADHAARLGMALSGNTDLRREFKAREQKAEHAEVEEWKGRYEHLDAWKLYEIMENMAKGPDPSKDQLKAILRILASKGRIDWRNPALWEVLNKLQSAVHLTPDDPVLLHNPPLLRQKLHTATGQIWDYDEYTSLEKSNEDGYDSSKKKFMPSLDRIQDQLTERLEQMLRDHRGGKNILGSEFEAVMEYAIENGKSYQEAVLFFLVMGMIEGILTPDRGLALDKHLNKFPGTQWIYDKKPPLSKEDYKWYASKYFPKDAKAGKVGLQFKSFFWAQAQNDEMTMQRVQKSVSERGWDHDWTRGIAGNFDAATAKRFLQGKSGQEEAKITGVQNALSGMLMWLEQNAKTAHRMDFRRHFAIRMGGVAMMDGILQSVAYTKETGAPFTKASAALEEGKPREGGVGYHGNWTAKQHLTKMEKFLDLFDPKLFGYLRDKRRGRKEPDALADDIIQHLKDRYPHHLDEWENLNNLNSVFDDLDRIIRIITSAQYVSDAQFLNNIQWLLQDAEIQKEEADYAAQAA